LILAATISKSIRWVKLEKWITSSPSGLTTRPHSTAQWRCNHRIDRAAERILFLCDMLPAKIYNCDFEIVEFPGDVYFIKNVYMKIIFQRVCLFL
jgi:hypothetical protein